MAYFKLSLLTKAYDPKNVNKYIKNIISEFYGNNVVDELKKYERENNLTTILDSKFDNVYTKTYTYNEKLNLHQQGQSDLSFSLDKMILDDDTWKDNPFASKIKTGSQVLLEDKYNNTYLFTVKNITYTITENNIVYNFTCQDSFSYQLAKQNDGYTINNDINSKDFIGALSVDFWAEKIVEECKIAYKYLRLETPLYLCTDGTAINTVVKKDSSKQILKILKHNYLKTQENEDLYETIPFSCSSTTANGALISLGEQIGLALKTATVLLEPENNSNFISLITYFWFEPAKQDVVNGIQYSPFRNVKTFNLSQSGDSLITTLNINSRQLSSGELITALPTVSPFFINFFNSAYWKKDSQYYQGMYTNALYGPQFSIDFGSNGIEYESSEPSQEGVVYVEYDDNKLFFRTKISDVQKKWFSLYNIQVYQTQKTHSSIIYIDNVGEKHSLNPDVAKFTTSIHNNTLMVTVASPSLADIATSEYIVEYEIHVFFKTQYSDEDETFAKIADQLPWLQNKLIDFSYFIKNGLLSKIQERDIKARLYNDLRKINSDILLNSAAYYSRIHAQTKYLSDMTNNIDMVGAELSNIASSYEQKGTDSHYSTTNLIQRWSLLQSNVSGAADADSTNINGSYLATSFVELYDTVSDYMRKFLNARQRCLKNLYNFKNYFNAPLDDVYKEYWKVTATIVDTDDTTAFNIYRFTPSNKDTYSVLNMTFAKTYPNFFVFDKNYTALDAKVVDYNNIRLYNNNAQHSLFDKENYLITADNYQDMNIHCYQDILHKSGPEDDYDKDRTYLRQVFFLRIDDVITWFNLGGASVEEIRKKVDASSFHLHIVTTHTNDSITPDTHLYPCHLQVYNKDTNYLIGWKKYEDGYEFAGDRIWFAPDSYIEVGNVRYNARYSSYWSLLDRPLYEGQYVADTTQDTIKFTNENNICEGSIFYQEIPTSQILRNYIYRQKTELHPQIKKSYTYDVLSTLLEDNTAENATWYNIYEAGDYTSSGVNFIGWGKYTDPTVKGWHIACGIMGIFNPLWWIGSLVTSFNLTDNLLVHGGYQSTSTNYIGTYSNFAPYKNAEAKRHSAYIKEYPLDAIYLQEDNGSYTKTNLVTNTNYTNFYCRTDSKGSNNSFSLAKSGTFTDLSNLHQIAKTKDDLYTDFVSDFPKFYFYSTKPLDTTSVTHITDGVALTFGNLIYHKNSYSYSGYKYRKTKLYKAYSYERILGIPDTAQVLVFEADSNYAIPNDGTDINDLNQYRDYDIIKKGKIQSKAEVLNTYPTNPNEGEDWEDWAVYFWLIVDGTLNELTGSVEKQIDSVFSETLANEYGFIYDIDDFYNSSGIVENLYYIEERVRLTPASLGDGYSIRDHLLDNKYEFYNEKEERVYTINQLFGNLTYKNPQSYTYYTFDNTIPQPVRLYQYNNESVIPDIINYELDASTPGIHTGDADSPYADFKYTITAINQTATASTNGELWYQYTVEESSQDELPLREQAALIESNLQMYWNEAYAASLLCDVFVPEEWRVKNDKVVNHFNVVTVTDSTIKLNPVYIPEISKTTEPQYNITWSDTIPTVENGELYIYDQLSDKWKMEVDKMLERTQNVSTDYLYFTKISNNVSFYTIKSGGSNWASFINQAVGVSMPDYTGWNGVAITYLTSHFVDAGTSNYELLLQRRDDLWRSFYEEYPYLFLETSYSNDSATTSEELLIMAKYAFEDQKYPEKSYSISLIDLVQDVETLDNNDGTYNPKYYRGPELHIGEGIKISAEDYTQDRDDIYEALSQLLFITDISRDLRNDGDCQLTVNTIKYQDKLIRRLAKMIRNNPLH